MKHLTAVLLGFFLKMGGIGLLILGILDSSFLFAPLGNDLLVVGMTASNRSILHMLYYASMSTAGSVLGCLLIDLVFRGPGEKGLEKHLSPGRLKYVKNKVQKDAAWALVVASLAPPPFPFTPFIMAASALQYSRRRLLAVVGAARMVRFTGLGVLALFFGRRILQWAKGPVVEDLILALIALCAVGSVISVYGWIKRGRGDGHSREHSHDPEPASPARQ